MTRAFTDNEIAAIYGEEPHRENEYPFGYVVGNDCYNMGHHFRVTAIMSREDNYGDHGIGWFDVFSGEHLIASISQRHVAQVHFANPLRASGARPTGSKPDEAPPNRVNGSVGRDDVGGEA